MAIYNTEQYLEKAIDSVINQTLNFEENVQLILVDDGSIDNSKEICLSYQETYPNNIVFLQKTHGGVSQARNFGMEYATGKYINFLDSDDYISENCLEEVYNFFKKNYNEIDVISIPMIYCDKINKKDKLNYKFSCDKIINLKNHPNNPQISISSTFIKRNSIDNLKFDKNLVCSEDTIFINKILLKKEKIGVLSSPRYFYRKRHNLSNIRDNLTYNKLFYIDRILKGHLELLKQCKVNYGKVPMFIQYTLLYDLLEILERKEVPQFENEYYLDEFFLTLKNTLSYIKASAVIANRNINRHLGKFILILKNDYNLNYFYKNDDICLKSNKNTLDTLSNHNIWIQNFEVNDEFLKITGFMNSYFPNDYISIFVETKYKKIYGNLLESLPENRIKYLSYTLEHNYRFNIDIPIDEICNFPFKLAVQYRGNDNSVISFNNIKFGKKIKLNKQKYLLKHNTKISFDDILNEFTVIKLFKFSIIMAIYNTANYLHESIDSIINQTLDFRDNVQLILVDDGSVDNSKEICDQYKEKYPNNIVVLSQKNSGQAIARNNGMNYVKGRYVNFLDSDDKLSENTLNEVYTFFNKHELEIDLVAIPMVFFERKTDNHMLNNKFDKSKIIDLNKHPNNPQFSASSAFIKYEVLDKFKFPSNVSFSEDAIAINKLLLDKKKYGVINTCKYFYRKRGDLSSTIDNVDSETEYFTDKLKYYYMELIGYCMSKEGKVPEFIKYTLAYDLQWLMKQPNLNLTHDYEKFEFWYYLRHVIGYLGRDPMINNQFVTDSNFKSFYVHILNNDIHREYENNNVVLKSKSYQIDNLNNHNLWIDIVSIENGILTIAGFLNSNFDIKNISFEAIKKENNGIEKTYSSKYVMYTPRKNIQFLDKIWQFKHNFEIKIPISPNEHSKIYLKTKYYKDGDKSNTHPSNIILSDLNIDFSKHAKLSNISNYIIKNNHLLLFKDNSFFIWPYSFKSFLKRELDVRKNIKDSNNEFSTTALRLRFVYLLLFPLMRFIKRNREIYLFMDRPDVADDNAMHLFKYANSIKNNVVSYYVLSKDSLDYKNMSKIGKMLSYKSFKHRLMYLFADKIISTHPYESVINPFFVYGHDERELYSGLLSAQIYFLQHGVTKDNISNWLTKFDKNFSLIVTVSDEEKKSFFDEGYTFEEDVVQVLGFPRYDNLINGDVKRQILIIPTWRKYLRGNKNLFINSDYFKSLNSLLNNEQLIKFADEHNFEIVFKPHPELDEYIEDTDEKYKDLLSINSRIKISSGESYQKLFNDSAILITDYSSVFFDFAYIKKPLFYYHPNDDYHYGESYFDYETMGFGKVITEERDLIDNIKKCIENDCQMETKYINRVDKFFKYNDKSNCKRVYNWILNH